MLDSDELWNSVEFDFNHFKKRHLNSKIPTEIFDGEK